MKTGDTVNFKGEHGTWQITNVHEDGTVGAKRWIKKTGKWSSNSYLFKADRATKVAH